jgi:hypothetical protein
MPNGPITDPRLLRAIEGLIGAPVRDVERSGPHLFLVVESDLTLILDVEALRRRMRAKPGRRRRPWDASPN